MNRASTKPPVVKGIPIFKLGSILLIVGVSLVTIAFIINVTFIKDTNFKEEYRQRQFSQCIANGSSNVDCQKNYGPN